MPRNLFFITLLKFITVDEMGVDELGVDKMGVDEMGSRRSGNEPYIYIYMNFYRVKITFQ